MYQGEYEETMMTRKDATQLTTIVNLNGGVSLHKTLNLPKGSPYWPNSCGSMGSRVQASYIPKVFEEKKQIQIHSLNNK